MFWQLVYNVFAVPAMFVAMFLGRHCAGCCNRKIREGIEGRKQVFEKLENQLAESRSDIAPTRRGNLKQTAWFHFTSVGEFEQAKPLIESIYAETRIVLTFFSPSVAPNVQSYAYADAAVYLPLDTSRNAERLIRLIEPALIVFFQIRYLAQPRVEGFQTRHSYHRRCWHPARPIQTACPIREALL